MATRVVTSGLLVDGSSDRALIPIIDLLFDEHCPHPFESPQLIDEKGSLRERITRAAKSYDVLDILFVHRDAESQEFGTRVQEIREASPPGLTMPVVCIVPVRMTEAWLLTDEKAIREAVGNPASVVDLGLPLIKKIETCEAKEVLFNAIRKAKDLSTRRMRTFRPEQFRQRVAQLTIDLDGLRKLSSFSAFETEFKQIITTLKG